jgi:hypothetical protein
MTSNIEEIKSLISYVNANKYEIKYPYYIFSYLLNSEISENSDIYGIIIPLGSFSSVKKAQKHINELSKNSKYEYFILTTYGKVTILRRNEQFQNILIENNTNSIDLHKTRYEEIIKQENRLKQQLLELEEEKLNIEKLMNNSATL